MRSYLYSHKFKIKQKKKTSFFFIVVIMVFVCLFSIKNRENNRINGECLLALEILQICIFYLFLLNNPFYSLSSLSYYFSLFY